MNIRRTVVAPFLVVSATLAAGCSGLQSGEVTQWGQAVNAAKEQSDASFTAVNTLARDRQIEYAATQPNLNAQLFHPALDDESVRAWRAGLDALASYATSVAMLADPATYAGTGASAAALGQAIAARAHSDAFTQRPGLADAVTKIGDAVAGAVGRSKAQAIMRDANPGVQDLLHGMSAMLSDVNDKGEETGIIPTTVKTNWATHLGEYQVAFLKPGADKLSVAREYAHELAGRDASIAALRALKVSLDRLAENHALLASGHPADTASVIAQMQDYTKLARAVLDDLKKQPAK